MRREPVPEDARGIEQHFLEPVGPGAGHLRRLLERVAAELSRALSQPIAARGRTQGAPDA
jgi:hypothetical protein